MKHIFPDSWDIPESIQVRVGERAGRQRAIFDNGHTLLILHDVPQSRLDDHASILFWRTPEGVWKANDRGPNGGASLQKLLGRYEARIDEFEKHGTSADEATEWFQLLLEINPVVRSVHRLVHVFEEVRREIGADREIINIRDRASDVERRGELLLEEAQFGMNFVIARKSEERNELASQLAKQSRRLNLITALFLPVTAITGIFGMNLITGIEHVSAPIPFLLSVLGAFAVGLYMRRNLDYTKH